MAFKHPGFKRLYYRKEPKGQSALIRLLNHIDRVTRTKAAMQDKVLREAGFKDGKPHRQQDIHEIFVKAKIYEYEEMLRYGGLKKFMVGSEEGQYPWEIYLQRDLKTLEEMDFLIRVEVVPEATRERAKKREKINTYYFLNYLGIAATPYDVTSLTQEEVLIDLLRQELALVKRGWMEAYNELGRSEEDFTRDYQKQVTANLQTGLLEYVKPRGVKKSAPDNNG